MPRKVMKQDRFLLLGDDLAIIAAPPLRERRRRGPRRRRRVTSILMETAPANYDPLLRTRRLLMAALRVWELKHGIHDPA
jgi:hypothetical protein